MIQVSPGCLFLGTLSAVPDDCVFWGLFNGRKLTLLCSWDIKPLPMTPCLVIPLRRSCIVTIRNESNHCCYSAIAQASSPHQSGTMLRLSSYPLQSCQAASQLEGSLMIMVFSFLCCTPEAFATLVHIYRPLSLHCCKAGH